MKIQFEKRDLSWVLLGMLVLSGIFVFASVDKTKAWHSASDVEVNVNGQVKSLQEAINSGDFSNGDGGNASRDVPDTIGGLLMTLESPHGSVKESYAYIPN